MTTCRSYRVFLTGSNLSAKSPLKVKYKNEIGTTPHLGSQKQNHPIDVSFILLKANTGDQGLWHSEKLFIQNDQGRY